MHMHMHIRDIRRLDIVDTTILDPLYMYTTSQCRHAMPMDMDHGVRRGFTAEIRDVHVVAPKA